MLYRGFVLKRREFLYTGYLGSYVFADVIVIVNIIHMRAEMIFHD